MKLLIILIDSISSVSLRIKRVILTFFYYIKSVIFKISVQFIFMFERIINYKLHQFYKYFFYFKYN